jgi:hypothetical protein
MNSHIKQPPQAVGLYDPRFEHDACGVGMVARLDNQRSRTSSIAVPPARTRARAMAREF